MIVITDGASLPNQSQNITNASASSGAKIVAVAVGSVVFPKTESLFAISYDPDDPNTVFDANNPDPFHSDHVFHADDFQELLNLVNTIADATSQHSRPW